MQKSWAEVLQRLLDEKILLEDEKGIIQIDPHYYAELGKHIPGAVNPNKERAVKLAQPYIDLWPKKIMSGGRPIRQGPTVITKKLNVFMNKHPKVKDAEILNATTRYTAWKKNNNWEYASCSDYFISKGDTSLLEAYLADPELGSKDVGAKGSSNSLTQKFI